MQDAYKDFEEYDASRGGNVLIVFDDMAADMISSKKFNPIVTELFIRGKNLRFYCFYHIIFYHLPST